MDELVELLRAEASAHSSPLWRALFATTDPQAISTALGDVVQRQLAPITAARFVHSGVGLVVGASLADGSDVVVKIHRWNVDHDLLTAMQSVQATLAAAGLPAPLPLASPTPCGAGIATFEELRSGDRADGHDPVTRRSVAAGLADLMATTADVIGPGTRSLLRRGAIHAHEGPGLWPEPHDLRFDFDRTSAGAEWIDDLARSAQSTLATSGPGGQDAVTHLDWRVQNLGFVGHRISAIYDWDSIGLAPEAVAVGQAAAQFSTDWSAPGSSATMPSLAEMRAFVGDYESHRGRSFDRQERLVADAANLLLCAYGARCQHSDRVLHPELAGPVEQGWSGLLLERGPTGLLD